MTNIILGEMKKRNSAEERICCQDFHGLSYAALFLLVFSISTKENHIRNEDMMMQVILFHKYVF